MDLSNFQRARFSVNDVYFQPSGLTSRTAFTDDFQFLGDDVNYERFFRKNERVDKDEFCISSIRRWLVQSENYRVNSFWNAFDSAGRSALLGARKPRKHWIPCLWRWKPIKLKLGVVDAEFEVSISPRTLVWPFGWFTSLDFSIRREMPPQKGKFIFTLSGCTSASALSPTKQILALEDIKLILAEVGRKDKPAFTFNGDSLQLGRLQKILSNRIERTIFKKELQGTSVRVRSRYDIVSVIPDSVQFYWGLTNRDRDCIAGTLQRAKASSNSLKTMEGASRSKLLMTPLSNSNGDFCLTDFNRGSILFLNDANNLKCLHNNIRDLSLVVMLYKKIAKHDKEGKFDHNEYSIKESIQSITRLIDQLPEYYQDQAFCRNFVKNYGNHSGNLSGHHA